MKTLLTICLFSFQFYYSNAQCVSNYSYSGAGTGVVSFSNSSVASNAHYYWDLGDGNGTNEIYPTHSYYSGGEYLVTLYVLDTVLNCSDVYESWISVTKPDTITCDLYFTDTIIGDGIEFTDLTTNCTGYYRNCRVAGPGQNFCDPWLGGGWSSALFLHSLDARMSDSINGYIPVKHFMRTRPFRFDPNKNYQNCSANFEINIEYQHNGALATFTAMNKTATSYEFRVIGFGNPILTNSYTASQFYQYRNDFAPWLVLLITNDTVNNCSDTVSKQFIVINPDFTIPSNCSTSLIPQSQTVVEGSNVQFIISTSPYVNKQWPQNAGLGFVDLYDAGPYSGVHSDTLTVSNVQLTMNNFLYRCIISSDSSGCHNTLPEIVLSVRVVGIDEIDLSEILIYPNPAIKEISLSLPENMDEVRLQLYDALGQEVLYTTLKKNESSLDISALANGIYLVKLYADGFSRWEKFIKY